MREMMRELSEYDPWLPLQSAYGTKEINKAKVIRFQSALINGTRFVACLTYAFTIGGVYVRPINFLPFLLRKSALFIPWEEIEIKKTDYWTTYPYEIHMKRIPQVDFRVRGSLGIRFLQCRPNSDKC
jgi:hypothetical protein